MSDVMFSGGSIAMKVTYENAAVIPSVQFVLFRNPLDDSLVSGGLDGGFRASGEEARYILATYDASVKPAALRNLAETAWVRKERSGEIQLKVTQTGSIIDLYADEVHVLRTIVPFLIRPSQCGVYCQATSQVKISDYLVHTRDRTAFVIMEFSPPFENLFNEVIRPVADECGFKAEKADDVAGPGLIIADIVRRIQEADIVIADVTPTNANVYYEIGYAHAIGKPTVILAEKGKQLPFDLSGFRTLFYENSIAGKSQIEKGLRRHIQAITKETGSVR